MGKRNILSRIVLWFIPVFLILFIVINLLVSNQWISISRYTYSNEKIKQPFTIVQLTDLHNYEFGSENARLLTRIRKEAPDLIFMTGDMLNDSERSTDIVLHLVEQAVQIAPVYYSLGNHEIVYTEKYDKDQTDYTGAF